MRRRQHGLLVRFRLLERPLRLGWVLRPSDESRADRKALEGANVEIARQAREEAKRLEAEVATRTAELRRTVAELERAQHQRDALLESERAARTDAERASRIKDEFVA